MRRGGGTYTSPSLRYPARSAYLSAIGRITRCTHGRERMDLAMVRGGILKCSWGFNWPGGGLRRWMVVDGGGLEDL